MDLELLVVDYVCNWLGDYSKYSTVRSTIHHAL